MIRSNLCRFMFIVALVHGCFVPADVAFAAEDDGSARRPPIKPSPMSSVSGRLRPNQSRQDGDAPYVILDRRGTVQYLVRPPTGKNLDPYVNREIRVSGQRIDSDGASPPILEAMKIGPPIGIEPTPGTRNARRPDRAVRPVAYQEGPLQPVAEGVTRGDPHFRNSPQTAFPGHDHEFGETSDWDSMDSGAPCGGCNQPSCQSCCNQICGPPGQFWVRAEYLYWWTEGMRVPPLVTTGPSAEQPGYLDTPGTTILFGDSSINGFGRSGVRLSSGTWLNACQTVGIAGDYYGLDTATTNYSASSPGDPICHVPSMILAPRKPILPRLSGRTCSRLHPLTRLQARLA